MAASTVSISRELGYRTAVISLWFRLSSLGVVGLIFALALFLGKERIQGWTFYLTTFEVVLEAAVRLTLAAVAGILLGTIGTAILAPFLFFFKTNRERLVEWTTKACVLLVLFLDSRLALTTLIKGWGRGPRFTMALLGAHFLFFVVALCIARWRKELLSGLDGFLGERMTRAIAVGVVIAIAALATLEFGIGKRTHTARAASTAVRPKSNIVLITFDAMSAEDMSLYGYKLPTTPNIDNFARTASVFTNFYSASTFTTPSVAAAVTGRYPSESHVHQLQGQVSDESAEKSLPALLHAAGYATGAFISNPYPYYYAKNFSNAFDVLPEPTFRPGKLPYLWALLSPLHQDSGIGSRVDEYIDLESLWNLPSGVPNNQSLRFRPVASFEQAESVLSKLPAGFFLWVHVMAPHDPYLPDVADQGRFVPQSELETFEKDGRRWQPLYDLKEQGLVDRRRLGYDEYVASADRAFGGFISRLANTGKLQDTTVIVSADHGESFEGGVYRHESLYLTRPVIHIPLIIKTPGQEQGRTVPFTADQTTLAPTILDLAHQPKPNWMRGESLATWLTSSRNENRQGLAFSQFLEKNSIFKPLRHGAVGVVDGEYQYVIELDTQKGTLRPLGQAQLWNLDRTSENPARAEALRAAIYSRFPELVHKSD